MALRRPFAAASAVAAALVLASGASAAGPGQYSPPSWLPLHHSSSGGVFVVGCVMSNCTISGAPYHNYWAIDLADDAQHPGAPVYAAGSGQVTGVVASNTTCGPSGTPTNYVQIFHGNGLYSLYVHLSTVAVTVGQWVDPTTQIGTVGAVGFTFPCPWYHLHFEVSQNGQRIPPPEMKACNGTLAVTYPNALGWSAWNDVPPYQSAVWSDGFGCVAPPSAPTGVAADAMDGRAAVSFGPPGADGGDVVAAYTVVADPGGESITATQSPVVMTGLANGTSYTFSVTATNLAGAGPAATSNTVTPAGVPPAPAQPVVRQLKRSVRVTFRVPNANGSPITFFTVGMIPGERTIRVTHNVVTVTDLPVGKLVRFRVSATNGVGTSRWSAESKPIRVAGSR